MTTTINGSSPSITFSDATTQTTSAVVSGKVPYSIMPTGSVLQVVNAYTTTGTSTTSGSAVDTTLSATITPLFSTSKILILMSANAYTARASSISYGDAYLYIVRGSTQLVNGRTGINFNTLTWTDMFAAQNCYVYQDTPATTSATTYKMQISTSNSQNLTVPFQSFATMTLMEIAA